MLYVSLIAIAKKKKIPMEDIQKKMRKKNMSLQKKSMEHKRKQQEK